jgi:hypothetical protein
MRQWYSRITVLGLACAGLLLASAPAFAQSVGAGGGSLGGSSFGGSSGSGSSFGSSGLSSGGAFGGSSSFGNSGSSSGSFTGGSSFIGGSSGTTLGSGTTSGSGRSSPSAAVGATSFLGANYGNPLAGAGGLTTGNAKFGTAQFNLTNPQNSAASSRATTPISGYFGTPIGLRRLPAYATTLKIKDMPPPETPAEVRTDLQVMLAQSGQLDVKDAVRVLMDGPTVVLQGQVADVDERRLVENMVRLTPGVNTVRNELAPRNPAP